jgi:hypothetical protein
MLGSLQCSNSQDEHFDLVLESSSSVGATNHLQDIIRVFCPAYHYAPDSAAAAAVISDQLVRLQDITSRT